MYTYMYTLFIKVRYIKNYVMYICILYIYMHIMYIIVYINRKYLTIPATSCPTAPVSLPPEVPPRSHTPRGLEVRV